MYFSIKYLDIKKGACGPGNVYSTFANNNFLKRTTDNNEKLHNPQIFECPHQLGCEKHTGTHRGVFLLYYVSQVVCSACLPKPVQSSATVSYNPVYSRVVTKPKSQCQVVQFIKHRPQIFEQQNGPASQFKHYSGRLWGLYRINRHRDLWKGIYNTSKHMFGFNVQMFLY